MRLLVILVLWIAAGCDGEESPASSLPCDSTLTGRWALDLKPERPSCPELTWKDYLAVTAMVDPYAVGAAVWWGMEWYTAALGGVAPLNVETVDAGYADSDLAECRVRATAYTGDVDWLVQTFDLDFRAREGNSGGTFEFASEPRGRNDAPACTTRGELRPRL